MIQKYCLKNKQGVEVHYLNYGGIITHIFVPDKDGEMEDIVLGFDNPQNYQKDHPYLGAIIGRYANRIANGRFCLDGRIYELPKNMGPNSLHGGEKGFDKHTWNKDEKGLFLTSPEGDQGYPGEVHVQVQYKLNDHNELIIIYRAQSNKATPINLTNHTYFNLGPKRNSILNHQLRIMSEKYTVVDENATPTGEIRSVQSTPFDFNSSKEIGRDIEKIPGGYDHNFILSSEGDLKLAAQVYEPDSGRVLEVLTTEPGLQFYSGNFLDGTLSGKKRTFTKHSAFCLETQHFPDSPNHENFPDTILRPGKEFISKTIYRFGVRGS
jgi:aldose 1-epimerase